MNEFPKNVLLQIESILPEMQPSEQKIARFILANPGETKFMSVNELSILSRVSEASVIRFVKKLGFKGYQHFKLALAALPSSQNSQNKPETEEHLHLTSSLNKYIRDSLISSINDTYSMLNKENLDSAATLICAAKKIYFVAIGPCSVTCHLFAYYLSELGFTTIYSPDPVMQIQNIAFSSEDDVVIAISHSGRTTDTLRILEIARSNKTQVITITHYLKSPIIDLSDILLCSYARKDSFEFFNSNSQVAQIFVMESLNAYIRIKLGEQLKLKQEKFNKYKEIKFPKS